jgi:hypothetical protein
LLQLKNLVLANQSTCMYIFKGLQVQSKELLPRSYKVQATCQWQELDTKKDRQALTCIPQVPHAHIVGYAVNAEGNCTVIHTTKQQASKLFYM